MNIKELSNEELLTELLSRFENLKCCGNCGNFNGLDCRYILMDNCCDKWKSDKRTKVEREMTK